MQPPRSPEDAPRRVAELQVNLEKAQRQLDDLQGQRRHQMQLVESIVRQRDTYRVLLAQTTGVSFPVPGECGAQCVGLGQSVLAPFWCQDVVDLYIFDPLVTHSGSGVKLR